MTGPVDYRDRSALLCSVWPPSASYRYVRVWTPLQRHYLLTYAGTPIAGAFRTDASYTLLTVVTRKGTRLALDDEVEPFVTETGESTFALTEEAVKIGDLRLEWQRARTTTRSCMSS